MTSGIGGVWNVPCYVCGRNLGSNKADCGKIAGHKSHSRPPCVWAESDNTIVLLCQKKEKAKRLLREEAEQIYQEQQKKYKEGSLLNEGHQFTQGRSDSEDDVFQKTPVKEAKKAIAKKDGRTPKKKRVEDQKEYEQQQQEPIQDADDNDCVKTPVQEAKMAIEPRQNAETDKLPLSHNEEEQKQNECASAQKQNEQDEGSRMVWTHEAKVCLYKWVIKLNPFGAKRGHTDAAWADVAKHCAESTKNVSRQKGKIDVSGHGLQVYIGAQMKLMRAKAATETKQSGQTGQLSNHETEELDLLQQIHARKQYILDSKDAERGEKELLDNIKAGQLGDAIYNKAMQKEPVKNKYIQALNRKRKTVQTRYEAIKDANKSCSDEQCLAKLSVEDRDVLLMWAKAKQEGHATTGKEDSDSDSADEDIRGGRGGKKKATVVNAIAEMSGVGPMMLQAMKEISPLEQQMTEYYRMKACAAQVAAAPDMTVAARLARLQQALDSKVITAEEHTEHRQRIIKEAF